LDDITIMNEPPLLSVAAARQFLRTLRYRRGRQRAGGPPTVAANLRLGLDRAGIEYRFNPGSQITDLVAVLSDADTLRWAIAHRRAGRIRRLVAGPNFPQPAFLREIAHPQVDLAVVASEWLRDLFVAQAPELEGRIAVWPVGVDERWWTPADDERTGHVLVYSKAHPPELLSAVRRELELAGLPATVISYGAHSRERYRDLLRSHRWSLFLSENEGQGIAMLEAWSCGLPTLAWDPGDWSLGQQRWDRASSAPYLTPRTGRTFRDVAELPSAIAAMESGSFDPRAEVLERFTAERCARDYAALLTDAGPDVGEDEA
jgi:glycosyltransferase involved in cell wall biosynthesis